MADYGHDKILYFKLKYRKIINKIPMKISNVKLFGFFIDFNKELELVLITRWNFTIKNMTNFYKEKYDVIIIGSALAGMACALRLKKNGVKDILILEQHNVPGGVATSFVRNGVEYEASLHEMMGIGNKHQLPAGEFFDEFGIDIEWLRVPEAYHYVDDTTDVVIHAGNDGDFSICAKEIAAACNDNDGSVYKKLMKFFKMMKKVHDATDYVTLHQSGILKMVICFHDLVRTAGYSFKEVLDKYDLPQKAVDILSAYWVYVGNTLEELPFNVYGYLLTEYLGYGSYIPKNTSHEMSLKMAMKCEEEGIQIEYSQKVEKILVKDGKVYGVRTKNGDEIHSDIVVCGAYPNIAYSSMIEPSSEVPQKAIKYINSREISLSVFSVSLLLDETPDKLNMSEYSTFYAPKGMDLNKIWDNYKTLGPYEYLTSICMNLANPYAAPKGKTLYTIVTLPRPEAWNGISEENYQATKEKVAKDMIELESKRLGVNLFDHIENCIIETPVTICHYAGAYKGSIYGYTHSMKDSVVARQFMEKDEMFIKGLFFTGAHQLMGDGMAPCIGNGQHTARIVFDYMKKRRRGK